MVKNKTVLIILISVLIISQFASLSVVYATPVSVIGTTDYRDYWPAYAQRTFYANGRFWVFWFNGNASGGYEVYSSSIDGVAWSSATTVDNKLTSSSRTYSIWFDGTYVYNVLVYANQYNNYFMLYDRGIPNSDGTITWNNEQVVSGPPSEKFLDFVQISVDSNGYPWIAYETYSFTDGKSYPFVIKSSTNDGTWQTSSGFPYQLSNVAGTGVVSAYGQGVYPLTSGKMVVLYGLNNTAYAQAWTGSEWLPTVSITGTLGGEHGGDWQWSAVPQGDTLNIACIHPGLGAIDYFNYIYATNSFSSVTVVSAPPSDGTGVTAFSEICMSLDPATNNLYVFYVYWTGEVPPATGISYVCRINGKWSESPTSLINDSIASALGLSVSNVAYDGYINVIYNEYSASTTYNVAFASFNIKNQEIPTSTPSTTSSSQLINWLGLTKTGWIWLVLLLIIVAVVILGSMKAKLPAHQSLH